LAVGWLVSRSILKPPGGGRRLAHSIADNELAASIRDDGKDAITDLAAQGVAGPGQTNSASAELAGMAESLSGMIERFQLWSA
jgi:methyl-accepting chemotaxis protein